MDKKIKFHNRQNFNEKPENPKITPRCTKCTKIVFFGHPPKTALQY
jgi:hypothetical protein